MERNLLYAAIGCFAGTLFSMFLIQYNQEPILLILLPMWGLVLGISIARVVILEKETGKRRR